MAGVFSRLLDILWCGEIGLAVSVGLVALATGVHLGRGYSAHLKEKRRFTFLDFERGPKEVFLLALPWSIWLGCGTAASYILGWTPGPWVVKALDTLVSPKEVTSGALPVLLSYCMLTFHLGRRFYESMYTSIHSQIYVNLLSHVMMHGFYFLTAVSVLAEGPSLGTKITDIFSMSSVTWFQPLGLVIFLLASSHQHKCYKIFASLRRNKAGRVVSTAYKIPRGDWFEWISCPHYFSEILIYTSIGIVLGMRNRAWCLCTGYVIINQVLNALFVHSWYRQTFPEYPRDRAAIIPFLL